MRTPENRSKYLLLGVLILCGLAVSGYLSYTKFIGTATFCLGEHASCNLVQNSSYAYLFGIPVAYFGLMMYLMLLGFYGWSMRTGLQTSRIVSQLIFGVALCGAFFSAYLTYIELAVLNAICQWCVISAAITFLILIVSWLIVKQEL